MRKSIPVLLIISLALIFPACNRTSGVEVIKTKLDPSRTLDHPLYYFEYIQPDNISANLYIIPDTVRNLQKILSGIEHLLDMRSSENALYMVRDDRDGNLWITRLESDRILTSDFHTDTLINRMDGNCWSVGSDDHIALCGVDEDGFYHIVKLDITRKEAEESFVPDVTNNPEISIVERDMFVTRDEINSVSISPDGGMVAFSMLNPDTNRYGLYIIENAGDAPSKVDELPLIELGEFSPDGGYLAYTSDIEERVELFLLKIDAMITQRVTVSSRFDRVSHPEWHPDGTYIIYTLDFTSPFTSGTTPLEGEQLFLYSMVSDNSRRLTANMGKSVWVDFAPNGDFLIYSTIPGTPGRTAVRRTTSPDDEQEEIQETENIEPGVETISLSYVPWIAENFASGVPDTLTNRDIQTLVTWTQLGNQTIIFAWGPG